MFSAGTAQGVYYVERNCDEHQTSVGSAVLTPAVWRDFRRLSVLSSIVPQAVAARACSKLSVHRARGRLDARRYSLRLTYGDSLRRSIVDLEAAAKSSPI